VPSRTARIGCRATLHGLRKPFAIVLDDSRNCVNYAVCKAETMNGQNVILCVFTV